MAELNTGMPLVLPPCDCGSRAVIDKSGTKYFACCVGRECDIETPAYDTYHEAAMAWPVRLKEVRYSRLH